MSPQGGPQPDEPRSAEEATFLEGVRLFNEQRYFDAHDAWEETWHTANGARRAFYQGLIHGAVTLEHFLRGNPRGVQGVWRMTLERLGEIEERRFMGLDLDAFLEDVRATIQPALDAPVGRSLMQRGVDFPFDRSRAPQIVLLD